LAKLIKFCFERRLRLLDILKDADHLRKGLITRTQLYTALAVLGINFAPHEYDALFQSFVTADDKFRYLDCAAVVEESIVKAKGPAGGNGAAAARAIMQQNSAQVCASSTDTEDALDRIETVIANRSVSRRLDIYESLDNLSRMRWARPGHVTEGQFIRVMKDLDFQGLTENDLHILFEKYCDTECGRDFNYVDFCRSVERRSPDRKSAKSKPDCSQMQGAFDSKARSGPAWSNPYFDNGGAVRPFGSRPNSAQVRRPQYASGMRAAGWGEGSRPQSAVR
jgi:hypothetical protein